MHIGIIGAGNISDTHARAAREIPGTTIAAVHGANREKAEAFARVHGGVFYEDFARFLAHRPMEMVAIGSPSGLHAQQGIAAARRGLHVLVEKPIDIATARADELIAAADAARVKLGVFFQDRLRPAVSEIKRTIVEGELGTPILISGRVKWHRPPEYYSGSRWRGTFALDGGGALINQAIHTLDLMTWLFGPVARVYAASATRLHRIEAEDTLTATLEFASGALGTIEATTSVFPGYPRRLEVTGTEGTMILEHDRLATVDLRTPRTSPLASGTDTSSSATTATVADASAHRRVLEDFIQAVETGRAPACDGREGRRSLALVEAIYESARTHTPVTLPPPHPSSRARPS